MSAVFADRDQKIIKRECFNHFDLPEMAYAGRLPKGLKHKQRTCDATVDRFFSAMNSDNRPTTREEAVSTVLPALWWITMIFSPATIQLIRAIAEWLWRRTQD